LEYVVIDCEHCGGWCCRSLNCSGASRSYWELLSPSKVVEINPWIDVSMSLEKNEFCTCKHLNDKGLCSFYTYRDEACRLYPNLEFFFMEYLDKSASFYVPWCTYRSIILQSLHIPFEILLTGEKCRQKYLQMIRENPIIANNFHGRDILIQQSYETYQSDSTG
jgi:hypothetical protein